MFKNREFRVKMVKTPKTDNIETTPTINEILHPDYVKLIEEAGNRFVKQLVIGVIIVAVGIKAIDTLGEIVIKKTKSA